MKIKIEGIKPHEIYTGEKIIELLRDAGIEVQPELRKYDWSKTLDDVLVKNGDGDLMRHDGWKHPTKRLSYLWQPNLHGKCPVDPDASIVRVRFMDGDERIGAAAELDWLLTFHPGAIISWQFVRLAEGYEW